MGVYFRQLAIAACVLGLFCGPPAASGLPNQGYRVLQSASELDYPPFALVRPDGSADGFSVDLLKAVVQAAGMEIRFSVGPWHEIKQALIDRQLDVLPLVSYSAERDEVMDFSASYLRMHGTIFVRKGNQGISSQADLKGKAVIVMRGDTAHEYAKAVHLSDHLILTDSFEQAMLMLSRGEHDAVVIQQLVGLELIKELGITNLVSIDLIREKDFRPAAKPLTGFEQKFCFAVQEGDASLLAHLNEGLSITIANGTYDALYDKWFGPILPPSPISMRELFGYLLMILTPLLFLILLAGLWYLKRQVAARTQSLRQEIKEREKTQEEKEGLIADLRLALNEVKTLGGLLPICASCKKIRDDKGYWNQIETYIKDHSNAEFSHGICPDCIERLYPEYASSGKK
jgi:ABC-type amino acid transport substrate-binding protein